MKVCGFSFVRNAIKYRFPVVESITSILPVCDHFIILVGPSDDGTIDLIKSINSNKIQIIESVWDESLKKGGEVLASETNKAFDLISQEFDWCFYLQADEVVHEKYLPVIQKAMQKWEGDSQVEGLLFKYLHFWGSYDYVANSRRWYRREIRVIKNNKSIRSYRDAQGFRQDDQKLHVKLIDACIYHYGYVKNPKIMYQKLNDFQKYKRGDNYKSRNQSGVYDYSEIESVVRFLDSHPAVMEDTIKKLNWDIKLDTSQKKSNLKNTILNFIEKKTGYRLFEYKNYKIVK
jgi:hypothetical protein